MKRLSLIFILTAFSFSACRHVTVDVDDYSAVIGMKDGTLTITPMDNNAIRVHFVPGGIELPQLENLIYTENPAHQSISCSQNLRGLVYVSSTEGNLRAVVNTRNGKIKFKDSQGNVILSESARSRSVVVGKTGDFNSSVIMGHRESDIQARHGQGCRERYAPLPPLRREDVQHPHGLDVHRMRCEGMSYYRSRHSRYHG